MADETPETDQQQPDHDAGTKQGADASPEASPGGEAGTPENVEHAAEQALDNVEQAAEAIMTETSPSTAPATPDQAAAYDLPNIASPNSNASEEVAGLSLLNDVNLRVKIELGRTHMYVEDVLQLNQDSVIELDKAAGDPVDIFVNDQLIARGEVLVLNENFCVRISEIVTQMDAEE